MRTTSTLLRGGSRVALALLLTLGAVLSGTGTASAAPKQPNETQVRAALARIADGAWTEADIALLKRVPEVGHRVPDPRDRGTLTALPAQSVPASPDSGSVGTLALSCYSQWSYVDKNDVFGSRIYRFNVETEWCYDTATYKLSSVDRAVGYLSNTTWGIYFAGWEVDSDGVRSDRWSGWNDKKAAVDYCIAVYGCYTQTHPYIYIELGTTAGSYPWSWKVQASSAG